MDSKPDHVGPRAAATRARLLEAAGEVFAAEGFRNATIQAICQRAGANIAAVNYHFGDKERLYTAVIAYADQCALEHQPVAPPKAQEGAPEERLQRQIRSFLSRLFDRGRPAWHAKLMAREMVDPTAALDQLVNERMRANHQQLAKIVRELIGPGVKADAVRLSVMSIIGQCVFYRHSAPVVARLYPDLILEEEVERIAAHITRFSLAALHGMRSTRKGKSA